VPAAPQPLRDRLLERHSELDSWQLVADELELNKTTVWRVANQGWLPSDAVSLQKLGIAAQVGVLFMEGAIIEGGALVGQSSRTCECGVEFIPNHPRRRRCFYCSPIRRKP
jgi:hypothetical protein